jgi:hypothetical protein
MTLADKCEAMGPIAACCSPGGACDEAGLADVQHRHDWQTYPAHGLEGAIAAFKEALPGYWFTVGECQVSADASCAPTAESPDIALIPLDRQFDDGFHVDLPQPATMADALRNVQTQALEAAALLRQAAAELRVGAELLR